MTTKKHFPWSSIVCELLDRQDRMQNRVLLYIQLMMVAAVFQMVVNAALVMAVLSLIRRF